MLVIGLCLVWAGCVRADSVYFDWVWCRFHSVNWRHYKKHVQCRWAVAIMNAYNKRTQWKLWQFGPSVVLRSVGQCFSLFNFNVLLSTGVCLERSSFLSAMGERMRQIIVCTVFGVSLFSVYNATKWHNHKVYMLLCGVPCSILLTQ